MDQNRTANKKAALLEFIFYGNYFYGLCAVALSVEATLQQRFPLNGFVYFFLIFAATVLYYSHPYIRKSNTANANPRTRWYSRHYNFMYWSQVAITVLLSASSIVFLVYYAEILLGIPFHEWSLILIFPVVGAMYYGINAASAKYNLRKIGWLKPFLIGFTWAGLVNVYPVLFYDIIHELDYQLNWVGGLLFLKNFMFITVLCIMFDIKDYKSDYIKKLKTFVVKVGLRKTIFYILLPLSVIGLVSFVFYAMAHQFNHIKTVLNIIPFALLIVVAYSLHRRRTMLYYLLIVDGLLIVKAVCGTIAILYF